MTEYQSKAKTTSIKATSKITLNLSGNRGKNNFFSVEYTEERAVPDCLTDEEMNAERHILWNTVNAIVDEQAQEIVATFSNSEEV